MNMQRCENGHYYDKDKFVQCPYCNPAYGEVNRTVPLDQAGGSFDSSFGGYTGGFGVTEGTGDIGQTVVVPTEREVTIVVSPTTKNGKSYDPVVGWLVCIDGPDKGSDYRIRIGNNTIGRGSASHIRIANDAAISQDNMALIAYNAKARKFFIISGEGRNQIVVNDEDVLIPHQSQELHAYDRILMGVSTLMFVPLCGGEFSWE
jgi:hypothetical protein